VSVRSSDPIVPLVARVLRSPRRRGLPVQIVAPLVLIVVRSRVPTAFALARPPRRARYHGGPLHPDPRYTLPSTCLRARAGSGCSECSSSPLDRVRCSSTRAWRPLTPASAGAWLLVTFRRARLDHREPGDGLTRAVALIKQLANSHVRDRPVHPLAVVRTAREIVRGDEGARGHGAIGASSRSCRHHGYNILDTDDLKPVPQRGYIPESPLRLVRLLTTRPRIMAIDLGRDPRHARAACLLPLAPHTLQNSGWERGRCCLIVALATLFVVRADDVCSSSS